MKITAMALLLDGPIFVMEHFSSWETKNLSNASFGVCSHIVLLGRYQTFLSLSLMTKHEHDCTIYSKDSKNSEHSTVHMNAATQYEGN